MQRAVTVIQDGREARVTYTEGLRSITGHQELGGEDIVAIVSMGSVKDWRVSHAWALGCPSRRRRRAIRLALTPDSADPAP